jgi:hypothetical protein
VVIEPFEVRADKNESRLFSQLFRFALEQALSPFVLDWQ